MARSSLRTRKANALAELMLDPTGAAQALEADRAHVDAVDLDHAAVVGLDDAQQRVEDRALARPGAADDADLLTAYLEARETLTADVRRFWGGIARRVEHDSADPAALADLAEVLRDTGEAYQRDAEMARTPDWAAAATARASLYGSAFRALRRIVRGSGA
jgi:hypothetical protein